MSNSLKEKAVIDWELCVKLANYKSHLAKELLALFIEELPESYAKIVSAYEVKKFPEMQTHIHKLHGACCYCGVPRLKEIVFNLETMLRKNNYFYLDEMVQQLGQEIHLLQETFKTIPHEANHE